MDSSGFLLIIIFMTIFIFYKCPEVVKKMLKLRMTDFLDENKMEYTKNFIKNLIKQSDPSFDEGTDK